tara:strand:- start:498 stop:716 length:219 start_codon:yes stop_codon:yes gene_type:complete
MRKRLEILLDAVTLIFLFLLIVSALDAEMMVYKDPNCGCCGNWLKHTEAVVHTVNIINDPVINNIKIIIPQR